MAELTGRVTDVKGAPVPQATIEVTSQDTGGKRSAATGPDGYYSIPLLAPGEYLVSASAPPFATASIRLKPGPGARIAQDFHLQEESAPATQKLPVTTSRSRSESPRLTQGFSQDEIRSLPNLTRNALQFTGLAGNLSDAGLGNRGAGFAINGQREASTNILLDGVAANDEFSGAAGQPVPLDAVREFTVLASGFTAEIGRASGGIVNMVGASGGNRLHGSAYEFNRVSRLSSASFKDNANGLPEASFQRNQFGYSVGGPVLRNRLFFFSSTEGTLVRSRATELAWLPTAQLLGQTAANTQSFFQALGQVRADARTLGTVSLADLTASTGKNPCTGLACSTLSRTLPAFAHVAWVAPVDAGAGIPQDSWNTFERLDYRFSDRTQFFARYTLYHENDADGTLSSSPYGNYDLRQTRTDNAFLGSVTHTWTPVWISNSKLAFTRLNTFQQGLTSRGLVPSMYATPLAPVLIGGDPLAFPGYNPFSPGTGGAFGGPQNLLQFNHDVSWTRGKHSFRFGGDYYYVRDNRTDAAYQTAVGSLSNSAGLGSVLNALQSGHFAHLEVAVDPQGKLPCGAAGITAACSLSLPVKSPDFTRSNRFHDGALYAQDSWKLRRRVTVSLGVRWEHYGVQHNGKSGLESNWYAPGVSSPDTQLGTYLRNGGLQLSSPSSAGGLYHPDWKDFAPRVGFAWDVFGDGRTSLRGGYGIGYERDFGNVNFNVIQNLPNFAVLDVPGPVTTNNFGSLGDGTGTLALPAMGARIVNPDLKTAYAHFWNVTVQREVTRGLTYSLEYSGSRGERLYTISYPNQIGFGNFALGDACNPNLGCVSQPNPYYGEDVGYRGNQGFSTYYGLNNRITLSNFLHSGVSLIATYTWSHAVDNMSSTFFEAGGNGIASQYGNRNITTNNGTFDTGLLDPYQPALDRGDADFDVRHRITLAGDWSVPVYAGRFAKTSRVGALLRDWNVNPVFVARSGQPFSVFDTSAQTLDLSAPRATFVAAAPMRRNTFVISTTPDTFHLITFLPKQFANMPNLLSPGTKWPANMSHRNAFRAPGFFNLDLGIHKDTRLTERFTLQLRAEVFNLMNHANLYVIGSTADVGASNTVDACFGCTGSTWDRRHVQLAAKIIF